MFCKKPTNCASLLEKRNNILNVFTKTRNDLTALLAEQQEFSNELSEQIKSLSDEKACADNDINDSKNMLSKINHFLN
jgi:septal ring factor EnvC (AmiA/AmiB activator)